MDGTKLSAAAAAVAAASDGDVTDQQTFVVRSIPFPLIDHLMKKAAGARCPFAPAGPPRFSCRRHSLGRAERRTLSGDGRGARTTRRKSRGRPTDGQRARRRMSRGRR